MQQTITPPMGWNSYDYYDTTVTEADIKRNADYMAQHLKPYGWEYIVVDIEWYAYEAGSRRAEHQYIPFYKVEMDEYSRLLPCPDRFPSSVNGKGFQPLADYVHNLGLKFGIHIMRGIPRAAAHNHTALLGTELTANEIANPYSICYWNPDMYGVYPNKKESQHYYNSLFALYAEWGVDFVKCDDICRMDAASSKEEIRMLHHAIENCGRDIILSLSPGPAIPSEAEFYHENANMWRITDDFWDNWRLLREMFDRAAIWQGQVRPGGYPDCDMLPVGYLGKGFGQERLTRFTQAEQETMLSLWCLVGSPLMLGAELPKLDEWTLRLLTNRQVLSLLQEASTAKELYRSDEIIIWTSTDRTSAATNIGVFNLSDRSLDYCLQPLFTETVGTALNLWSGETISTDKTQVIPAHGALLVKTGNCLK